MTKAPFEMCVGGLWRGRKLRSIAGALAVLANCAIIVANGDGRAMAQSTETTAAPRPDNLSLPRFVSLKSDRVNLRSGPGTEYPTSWVYRRAGMPVEITKEFEVWRQVRDAEGASGWVLHSLLSGRRTALVMPWDVKPDMTPPRTSLYSSDSERSRAVAVIEAGVIANIQLCDGKWCRVTVGSFAGYIEQLKLWGVYPNETIR